MVAVLPSFDITNEFEITDKSWQFTLIEEVRARWPCVALQVPDRCEGSDEDATGGEYGREHREEVPVEVVEHHEHIPWPVRQVASCEVRLVYVDGHIVGLGSRGSDLEGYVGNICDRDIPPLFGQPDGVASRPACDIENAAGIWQHRYVVDQPRRRVVRPWAL